MRLYIYLLIFAVVNNPKRVKVMKKLLVLVACAFLSAGSVSAQFDSNVFTHLGASVGVGSTGVTIDLSTNITSFVGVRAGVDIMPKFKYSTDIKIAGVAERQVQYDQVRNQHPELNLPAVTFPQRVDIQGKANNTTGHILFDVYPGNLIDWHLTVGAYFGSKNVIDVYTTDASQLQGVYQYNNSAQRAAAGFPKIGAQLGDFFLEPDASGIINATIETKAFRPYVGIGWGRGVPKNHRLGFAIDLGAQFWGTPKVYCQGNELKAEDVGNSDGGVMKTLTKVKVYPTLTFRLTGKIL